MEAGTARQNPPHDVTVAKNYLNKSELEQLQFVVSAFLIIARASSGVTITIARRIEVMNGHTQASMNIHGYKMLAKSAKNRRIEKLSLNAPTFVSVGSEMLGILREKWQVWRVTMSKITPSIYKIDLDKLRGYIQSRKLTNEDGDRLTDGDVTATAAHERIAQVHDYKRAQVYQAQRHLSSCRTDYKQSAITRLQYTAQVHLGVNTNGKDYSRKQSANLLFSVRNLAAFITFNNTCYAISAGSGYTLFEQFIRCCLWV